MRVSSCTLLFTRYAMRTASASTVHTNWCWLSDCDRISPPRHVRKLMAEWPHTGIGSPSRM